MAMKMNLRLTVNVTPDEYAAFIKLARKAQTSPSALLQHGIRRMIAEGDQFIPLVPPAAALPEEEPAIGYVGTWFAPTGGQADFTPASRLSDTVVPFPGNPRTLSQVDGDTL